MAIIAQVALHECCHSMGLLPSPSANYNRHNDCRCGAHHMDSGAFKPPLVRLGFIPYLVQGWMQKKHIS